jgi:DNA-binding beta-propeller fold protein YncE
MKKTFLSPVIAIGVAFAFLAVSGRADTVYVVNSFADTVEQFSNGVASVFAIPSLFNMESFAYDRAGNLYVLNSDVANAGITTIEKFTTNGVGSMFAKDDGSGSILNDPLGMAFDTNGVLYVANSGNNTIEKFDTNGVASVFVEDDGSGSILNEPAGLAFDSAGNLYVANEAGFGSDFIEELAPSGTHKTFATDPGDGSVLNSPNALAFDSAGNLYVANEMENSTIEKFTPGGTPSTFVSSGLLDAEALAFDPADNLYVLNVADETFASSVIKFDANATSSTFGSALFDPSTMASDSAGNIFVADFDVIKEFEADGGQANFAYTSIFQPRGLALDSTGNLYLANFDDGITKFTAITTNGDSSTFGVSVDEPVGIGFDPAGNLYVANSGNNTISKIIPNGNLSLFASDPGDGSILNDPLGLAVDSSGNVYVTSTQSIEKFSNGTNSVFASITNGSFGPGLAFDKAGNLYAEVPAPGPASYKIEKYAPNGNSTTFTNDPGNGSVLNLPEGMAFDSVGNLYVVNSGNNTIEKFATNGTASVFAADPGDGSVLDGPTFIAIQPGLSLSAAAPILTITTSGTNAFVSWPVAAGSFNLQSTTNLNNPNWITISGTPGTIAGNFVVTNAISSSTRFFRLKSN